MSRKFLQPRYLENQTRYVIEIPFVQTSGAPGNRYEWNNAAHAAVHSILAALIHGEKKSDLIGWLETAASQLDDAVKLAKKKHARPLPGKRHPLPV